MREAEWIAQQRAQLKSEKVKRGVKRSFQETLTEAERLGQAAWTETHEKYSKKLDAKSLAAKIRAYEDGFLLPDEIDDDLLEAVDVFTNKRITIDRQHEAKAAKIKRTVAVQPPVDMTGEVVFIDPTLQDDANVKSVVRLFEMTTVSVRAEARIFIVSDLKQPGQRTEWALSLCGGLLLPRSTFCHEKQVGAVVRFKAAVMTKRMVFITNRFAKCHPVLAELVTSSSTLGNSKWTLIRKAEYDAHNATQAARAKRLRRTKDALALVTKTQKREEPVLRLPLLNIS